LVGLEAGIVVVVVLLSALVELAALSGTVSNCKSSTTMSAAVFAVQRPHVSRQTVLTAKRLPPAMAMLLQESVSSEQSQSRSPPKSWQMSVMGIISAQGAAESELPWHCAGESPLNVSQSFIHDISAVCSLVMLAHKSRKYLSCEELSRRTAHISTAPWWCGSIACTKSSSVWQL